MYSKQAPNTVEHLLGDTELDAEGRAIWMRFGKLQVINAYFPKGSGKDRDNSRVDYKLKFYRALLDEAQRLRKRYRVLIMGDYNTAHTEIDLARPKTNTLKTAVSAGRAGRAGLLGRGGVDRHLLPPAP